MALSKLKFLSYNNYNSRDAEKKTTFANYNTSASDIIYCCDYWIGVGQTGYNGGIGALVSFNPGDGVNTYGIEAVDWVNDWEPNYLVVATENNVIESRWFVMDFSRTKLNQFKMELRRDVIVDNFDQIKRAEIFIEKATLPDSNPLIFNSENFAVNQIKTSELLLKDRTNCAWIVGYLDRKYSSPGKLTLSSLPVIGTYASATAFPYNRYIKQTASDTTKTVLKLKYDTITDIAAQFTISGTLKFYHYTYDTQTDTLASYDDPQVDKYNNYIREHNISLENEINAARRTSTALSKYRYVSDDTSDFLNYNGRVITFEDNTTDVSAGTYQIQYTQENTYFTYDSSASLYSTIENIFLYTFIVGRTFNEFDATEFTITTYCDGIGYTEYIPTTDSTYKIDSLPFGRAHLLDQPFDLFAIPYLDGTITNSSDGSFGTITATKTAALTIAEQLATQLGDFLFDIQLLPYCPLSDVRSTSSGINLQLPLHPTGDNNTINYTFIKDNSNNKKSVMLWSTSSTGTKTIDVNINYLNKKLDSQTDFIRIVSPNFNGQYEFNHVKNDELSQVTVHYTYLPYNPFLQINPVLNSDGIYRNGSSTFTDARGLCVQGDFSITTINDKWIDYQIQNKNFQNTFDRKIQSMDFRNNIQREQEQANLNKSLLGDLLSITTQTVGGNISGAVGTAFASGINRGFQQQQNQRNEAMRQETLDFTRDQFGYQLGNIQAMPQSIGKTTAINAINKIFPMIETYTCTLEEKKALANKIRHNGMTVMAIGKITDFYANSWSWSYTADGTTHTITARNYFKGKLIKIPDFVGDNHMLEAIAEELDKGIYIKGSMIS